MLAILGGAVLILLIIGLIIVMMTGRSDRGE